jgi:small subunit ribosomal protein S9
MVKKTAKKSEETKKAQPAASRYFEAKGARKTAVARVRLHTKQGGIVVNGKDIKEYFKDLRLQREVLKPIETMNVGDKVGVTVKVAGGGLRGQAEAVRHGIARALLLFNEEFRKRLRRAGLLTRDARMVERKKYGLKKARRAPQWAKR